MLQWIIKAKTLGCDLTEITYNRCVAIGYNIVKKSDGFYKDTVQTLWLPSVLSQ